MAITLNFRSQLARVAQSYEGYDPDQGFLQRLSAQLRGHGATGHARKLRLIQQVVSKKISDEEILSLCIYFYLNEIKAPSSKGSDLMRSLKTLLQSTLNISDEEIERNSPRKTETFYLGACDGACGTEQRDIDQGFLTTLRGRCQAQSKNLSFSSSCRGA